MLNSIAYGKPAGIQSIPPVFTNTSTIGTPEHPTINGGIIHSTDVISLNEKTAIIVEQERPVTLSEPLKQTKDMRTPYFQDSWATNERVKHFLISASKRGQLDYVLKQTEALHIPASVALLPMVESNYQPSAVSNKGAAGVWQLMPATANDLGVKSSERFKLQPATTAALKYLKALHEKFNNWELAFAAYNAGEQRVRGALSKNPKATCIDDLALPAETKQYVKRIKGINAKLMEWSHV